MLLNLLYQNKLSCYIRCNKVQIIDFISKNIKQLFYHIFQIKLKYTFLQTKLLENRF